MVKKMTDAPERMGAVKLKGAKHVTYLGGNDLPSFPPTTYVRADIHQALEAERGEQVQWVKDLADELINAEAERDRLRAALVECRDEIDGYIRQEYPGDHPINVRRRERDVAANPARIALGESND